MKVKPVDQSAQKWAQRASAAGPAYTSGVQNPSTSWATATGNASTNWANGVQAAAQNDSFKKGVAAAGDSKWQNGAVNKGAGRYTQGVTGAAPMYSAGFGKYATALTNATLPPRFPKGDPNNMARSAAVATLLRNVKLGKAS